MSEISWICVSIKTKNAELEFANKKKPSSFPKGSIRKTFLSLVEHLTKDDKVRYHLLEGLFKNGRVSSVRDAHVSSFYGQNTSRIQYLFPEYSVLPIKGKVSEGKKTLCAAGLTSDINKTKVRANVCLDVIVTNVKTEDIGKILVENPSWFCGEMDAVNEILSGSTSSKA